jgi:hypothetical protein
MAKEEKTAVSDVSKTQAQRFMEIAKAKRAGGSGQSISETLGKSTLRRNARKAAKGGVGGGDAGA